MTASSSRVIPTPHADNQGEGHPRGAPLRWHPTKLNLYDPGVRSAKGFSVLPEVYFSGSKNVQEFLQGIQNQIRLLEIPSDLSCAYLKGHLLGRVQDCYQIFRPQANRPERVNRDLEQMIASYVNDQHDTWDQFLREFAYAIRTAVNETMGKTLTELFLVRKFIISFQKLMMVSDGTEFAVGQYVNIVLLQIFGYCLMKLDETQRSPPGSWSEPSGKLKRRRKENVGYKRSRESGSGGTQRKINKGLEDRVTKRELASNYNNDSTKFRKKRPYRRNSNAQNKWVQPQTNKMSKG
ncbi:uncharacterized protein TNCV_3991801 [Trichonephila clavipes]|uniref:Uncharacterized protein n=1 Tax=Trichonephila clavipes TaxID=2585209 RepID=A0A8X6SZQ1_TRICX|nr:uncharacterized protein TNCV_3991801 [Trichonephila clavipes]